MDFWVVFNLEVVVGERERYLECSTKSIYKQLYKMTVGISFSRGLGVGECAKVSANLKFKTYQ